jgi:hypothetical protein
MKAKRIPLFREIKNLFRKLHVSRNSNFTKQNQMKGREIAQFNEIGGKKEDKTSLISLISA